MAAMTDRRVTAGRVGGVCYSGWTRCWGNNDTQTERPGRGFMREIRGNDRSLSSGDAGGRRVNNGEAVRNADEGRSSVRP